MNDENAFGALISWYDVEDEEYSLERDEFVERLRGFSKAWRDSVEIFKLGAGVRAIDFGHSVYFEIAEGDQSEDPIVWLKMVRARILEQGFTTVGVATYGGRWTAGESPSPGRVGVEASIELVPAARSSEPLRRALYAETAARQDDEDAPDGWGPGLYADAEAIEALCRKFKNAPTPLDVAGATFFRVGS